MSTTSPSSVISVPLYFPYSTLSPTFTVMGTSLPSSYLPGPAATISPCCGFSFAVSGMYRPPRICSVSSDAFTTTRSDSGVIFAPAVLLVAKSTAGAKITPLSDRVVVKASEDTEQMRGGLYIPDTAKEKPQQGEIVAAGPGKYEDGKL